MIYPDLIRSLPPFDGPFDAYRLKAENCEVLFASYPPGTKISPHAHETNNVGIITRGELILTIDGKTERFAVGDWYQVPANIEHSAEFEVETSEIEFWFSASNT